MTDSSHPQKPNDEDLLAGAIPVPPEESEEDDIDEFGPIELDGDLEADDDELQGSMIQAFGSKKHEASRWQRQPTASGKGATHVRTFVAKLRMDAIEHIDDQINEWLDENPNFDVKFVTTSVGPLIGKATESAMFVNVWV